MEVRILGPLEVRGDDGRPISLGPTQQRAVLALLALEPGRVMSADRIADELWGDSLPAAAANTVQAYVSRLRKVLGAGVIRTRAPGYVLDLAPDAVDAGRFEQAAGRGRDLLDDGDPEAAAAELREGLDLWRGPALADVAGVGACEREAGRLEEARVQALEDRMEADLALGRHAEVTSELTALVADHPLRERLYAHLMLALYRCGRQGDALARYAGLRNILDSELGIEPSPELQRLERAILRQESGLDWAPAPPRTPPPPPPPPRVLPELATSFVGRERERADVADLLRASRLVTLTGPGGSGKTRLALETARGVERAWFVELSALDDPALVAQHVARTLGIAEEPGRGADEVVAARLAPHDGLLILDNCEHLVEACARLAHHLVSSCRSVAVLATSREPLRAAGETLYRVGPIPVPALEEPDPLQTPAARLFVDRALATSSGFVAAEHAEAIADVVRRLDGIPLAIELAAARSDVLTPAQIAERLDDVLGLLTAGPRTDVPHHRTLRAALQWSHDTLTDAERALFRRLSVFVGGFTLADVEAVCGRDALDDLSRLVSLSLVESSDRGDIKRFSMLETVRSFAFERLAESGESSEWRGRHLRRFVEVASLVQPRLAGAEQATAADELETNTANLRAALRLAIDERADPQAGLRLVAALGRWWHLRGHLVEARRWLQAAVETHVDETDPVWIAALLMLGGTCILQGDLSAGAAHMETLVVAARKVGNDVAVGRALLNLGNVAVMRNDLKAARELLTEAAQAGRSSHDRDLAMRALNNLGQVVSRDGDYELGREMYEEAIELGRELGNDTALVLSLLSLADLNRLTGRRDEARTLLEEALTTARSLGFAQGISAALGVLGNVATADGDLATARECFTESVEIARRIDVQTLVAAGIGNLAAVAEDEGNLDEARVRYEEYRTLCDRTGDRRGAARARRGLSDVFRRKGDLRRSARLLRAAIQSTDEVGDTGDLATCLESAAALAIACGEPELAGRLLGAAQGVRPDMQARERQRDRLIDELARDVELTPMGDREAVRTVLDWLNAPKPMSPSPVG